MANKILSLNRESLLERSEIMRGILLLLGASCGRRLSGKYFFLFTCYKIFLLLLIDFLFFFNIDTLLTHFWIIEADKRFSGMNLGICTATVLIFIGWIYGNIFLITSIFNFGQALEFKTENQFKDILKDLRKQKQELNFPDDLLLKRNENLHVALLSLFIFVMGIVDYVSGERGYVLYNFGFWLSNTYCLSVSFQLDYFNSATVFVLGDIFQVTRKMMKFLLENSKDNLIISSEFDKKLSPYDKILQMRNLMKIYRKCVALCREINKLTALQTLFSIALSFALVVTFLFLGSLLLIQKTKGLFSDSEFTFLLVDVLLMIFIHLVKLMVLIIVCSRTTSEADKILQLGRKVIIEDSCPELTHELSILVKVLKEEKVVFSANDFFLIDYPLFISFIGAATTYWVIMVQFQLSASS